MDLLIASVRTNLAKGRVFFSLFNSFAYRVSGRLERCISEFCCFRIEALKVQFVQIGNSFQ